MLETLNSHNYSLCKNIMDTTIDNQQATLSYLAGLFEGEGSVIISKISIKGNLNYRAAVQFTNTEIELIKAFASFCDDNNITYHIRGDERPKRKAMVCYQLAPCNTDGRIKILELLSPYFRGVKKEVS